MFTKSPEEDHSLRLPVSPAPWAINCWVMDDTTAIPEFYSDADATAHDEVMPEDLCDASKEKASFVGDTYRG